MSKRKEREEGGEGGEGALSLRSGSRVFNQPITIDGWIYFYFRVVHSNLPNFPVFFGPQEVEEIQKSIHQQYESKIEETILRLKKTEQSKHHLENKVAELTKELAERKRMEARRSSQTRDSRHKSSYSRVTDGYSSDESRFVNFWFGIIRWWAISSDLQIHHLDHAVLALHIIRTILNQLRGSIFVNKFFKGLMYVWSQLMLLLLVASILLLTFLFLKFSRSVHDEVIFGIIELIKLCLWRILNSEAFMWLTAGCIPSKAVRIRFNFDGTYPAGIITKLVDFLLLKTLFWKKREA